uniref:Uncharacterized protein n=1 Tax=Globodera rostochiensis TaxID=31243 RepID=A0A914I993_GLORO
MSHNIQALILIIYIARTHATIDHSFQLKNALTVFVFISKWGIALTKECAKLEEFLGASVLYALTKMTSDPTLQKILHVNADGLYVSCLKVTHAYGFFAFNVESKKSQAGIDTLNSDQFRSSTQTTSSCTASTNNFIINLIFRYESANIRRFAGHQTPYYAVFFGAPQSFSDSRLLGCESGECVNCSTEKFNLKSFCDNSSANVSQYSSADSDHLHRTHPCYYRSFFSTQKCTYSLRIREGTKALDELYKITDKCAKLEEFLGDNVLYATTKVKLNLMPLDFLLSMAKAKNLRLLKPLLRKARDFFFYD